ncbi:nucleotide sugar dehydrogenase [Halosimplex sp. TS25]|uniref:nucleotide sugar dehydrogenase n=1 Tax=Halosimplex rarum TaxID=3396619 RepID=UPI0039EBAEBD
MTAIPIEGESTTEDSTAEPATVCVVGLGYVGLPLAVAFDEAGQTVVGFDVDDEKVDALADGRDPTGDVDDDAVAEADTEFTTDPSLIERADFVIITVPTPIDDLENPDLEFVRAAGETVGEHMSEDTTVVLESTVFPGATETVLVPELEAASGFTAGEEFDVGYSPERASPGDEGRGVRDVVKIVGADDEAVRERLAELYSSVVDAGIYRAPDVETAETAKVIENVQRDLNIALVNELAIACDHMDLSTEEVLAAARTKWNFHGEYSPGLVGGHCIPVDPHYLAHRSERDGFSPTLVLKAREINEYVPTHVAELTVKGLNDAGNVLCDSSVLLLGLSYKPNVGDVRTSEVDGVVDELSEFGVDAEGFDPHVPDDRARETFDVPVQSTFNPTGFDGLVVATAHDEFEDIDFAEVADAMAEDPVVVDVPGTLDEQQVVEAGFEYRRL